MNPIDFCLERLYRAARPAPDLSLEPPFGLETRVLAAWRRGLIENPYLWLPLMRGACIGACAIIAVALALSFHTSDEPPPSELVIVDSAIQFTLMQ